MKTPLHVFLVEDNKDDQFFFSAALGRIDFGILDGTANNGKEALELLRDATTLPDVIFTDIQMPEMDGIEFLMEIAKHPRLKFIPIVVLAGATSCASVARQLGAKAFIKKPVSVFLLRQQLEQLMDLDLTIYNPTASQTFQAALQEPLW